MEKTIRLAEMKMVTMVQFDLTYGKPVSKLFINLNSCKLFIMYNKLYETCNEKMRETCFRTQRINVNYLRRKDWVRSGILCSPLN